MPGARNAVETCLAIQPGEKVTLIADRASGEVAASLDRALRERHAVETCFSIEALAARPLVAAPPEILASLSRPMRAFFAFSRRKASSLPGAPSSASSSAGEFAMPIWSA